MTPVLGHEAQPCAERLIERFGTIGRVLSASPESLGKTLQAWPVAAQAIQASHELFKIACQEQLSGRPFDLSDRQFQHYLITKIDNRLEERLFAVFLDEAGILLKGEVIASGGQDTLFASYRSLIHRALDLDCRTVMFAHNHPSGSHVPSRQDWEATAQAERLLEAVQIRLADHLIVARGAIYSMRRGGLV